MFCFRSLTGTANTSVYIAESNFHNVTCQFDSYMFRFSSELITSNALFLFLDQCAFYGNTGAFISLKEYMNGSLNMYIRNTSIHSNKPSSDDMNGLISMTKEIPERMV